MDYALGIDVGTTFSAAAVSSGGRTDIFQLGTRAAVIPSVVLIRADGEVLTGEAAERRSVAEPTRTGREFKRRLGDPVPLVLGGAPYGAEALTASLLRAIVARVEQEMGGRPAAIAVSHPASYGPYKLDLLRQAARAAEIGEVEFISEPEAAAIHYARQERLADGEVLAVYDFGGGTFDAAILRKTPTGFEALGTPEGLERLGGIDFDEAVFVHVVAALGGLAQELDPEDSGVRIAMARLREECRNAKEALSGDTDTVIPVSLPNVHTEVRLTRSELEAMVRPRVGETIAALDRSVRSAGLTFAGINRILLVGGTSRMPIIAQMIGEATGCAISLDANPKNAIALGAASAAYQRLAASITVAAPAPPVAAAVVSGPTPPAAERPAAAPVSRPITGGTPVRSAARPPWLLGAALIGGAVIVVAAVAAFLVLNSGGSDDKTIAVPATAPSASTQAAANTTQPVAPAATAVPTAVKYPANVVTSFMSECVGAGGAQTLCQCSIDYIQGHVTYQDFTTWDTQARAGIATAPAWAAEALAACRR